MEELRRTSQIGMDLSEEDLSIIQMALMRGMISSNPYFKERCEKVLQRVLRMMAQH